MTISREFFEGMVRCKNDRDLLIAFGDWCRDLTGAGTHVFNPYHNEAHIHIVMEQACSLYVSETGQHAPPELMFAAAMHDFNHTGGSQPDAVNIERALHAVERFSDHPYLRAVDLAVVKHAIECTYFDGRAFPNEPTNVLEKCLRDADLATAWFTDGAELLLGLYEEMRVTKPALEFDAFVKGNRAFLLGATMYTAFGNDVKENELAGLLDKTEVAMYKLYEESQA